MLPPTRGSCWLTVAVRWSLLDSLGDDERREVLSATRRRRYGRGELVVREGDPSDSLHLVESGRLAVQVSTADGDHATINLLGRGDYFGELSLLDGHPPVRSATIVALEPAETLSLSAGQFQTLRTRHQAADRLLLRLMAERIEELSARVLEATYESLDQRVYRRLTELARLYDDDRGAVVTVPLTQEAIAQLVGGTRQSVNQVLQRLAAREVVEIGRGWVRIVDRAWLDQRVT